jgi:hypothetical protein
MKRTLKNCALKNKYGADIDRELGKCFGVGYYRAPAMQDDELCEMQQWCKKNGKSSGYAWVYFNKRKKVSG